MTQAITVPVVIQTWASSRGPIDPTSLVVVVGEEPMSGYIECGRAQLTFIPESRDVRVAREVAQLESRLRQKQADAEMECNQLRERINNLLALTYEAPHDVA